MARMGLDKELRTLATTVASELAEAEEGLTLTEQAVRSCRAVEERFEASAATSYAAAQAALVAGDEDGARAHLVERSAVNQRLAEAKLQTVDAEARVERMRISLDALAQRAAQVETLMGRAVSGALESRAVSVDDDPLLRKFRDLEGK
uniref:Uncharacterized protein n=1 Tax=Haptolina ericina TaxID=156174 RepID=A0A7S3B451_9EUKA